MSESSGIDSISGGSMPKPYSNDLRARVIEAIEAGGSRCEAAERYEISASAAVLWAQRWEQTGSFAAKPSGGSISRLEEHGEWLLALISEHSDLTLDEVVLAMRKRRIACSRSAVWRFFDRHKISFKKKVCGPRSKSARTSPARGGAGCESKACLIRPDWYSSTRPARAPLWCGPEAAVRAACA